LDFFRGAASGAAAAGEGIHADLIGKSQAIPDGRAFVLFSFVFFFFKRFRDKSRGGSEFIYSRVRD
jgi:hypothetical protein